jgi:hypothetical protein
MLRVLDSSHGDRLVRSGIVVDRLVLVRGGRTVLADIPVEIQPPSSVMMNL